jgi:phage gp37-like protein
MIPTPAHTAFRNDTVALLKKHEHLSAVEMLAVTSILVGQLIALQDQRTMTPAQAMEIVSRNIEIGNMGAIDTFLGNPVGTG